MTKNRLHSFIHRFNLRPPDGPLFSEKNRSWWQQQDFSSMVRLQIEQDLLILEHLTLHKEAIHQELACLSNRDPWADDLVFLMQIPGLGVVLSMTVLSAIGDISRFERAKNLVGYAGLGAGVHHSGQKHQGKGTLAPAQTAGAVQVSPNADAKNYAGLWLKPPPQKIGTLWGAVRSDPHWKSQYEHLKLRGKHANEAIVATPVLATQVQVLLARCSLPFGMFFPNVNPVAIHPMKTSPTRC